MPGSSFSTNLGLDLTPQTKDPENLNDFYRLYNAVKLLAYSLDSYTGVVGANPDDWATAGTDYVQVQNQSRLYVQFDATVTVGQLLTLNSSGRAVLGTNGNVFGWAPAGVTSGQIGEMRLLGLHTAITGMTPGAIYYASSTPGGISTGPGTAAGYRIQPVGFAITANKLFFNPQYFAPAVRPVVAADGLTYNMLSLT